MALAAALTPAATNVRVLLAIAIVVLAARLFGWLIAQVGQPQVHGEILSGIVLGPSLLGVVWPDGVDYLFPTEIVGALEIVAQLGLVIFMFLIGLELDLPQLRGQGHRAVLISHASILLPIVLGVVLGLWLHPRFGGDADRSGFVLFLGVAMAITAFPVLARVLQETGLSRTRVGVLTMTCAAVDDITAWCMLAGVVAIVKSAGFAETLTTVALSLAFVVAMLGVVRPLLARVPAVPVWAALALALGSAWTTEEIGIHAIFGAFLAGAVMPRGNGVQQEVKLKLETVTLALLLPVFFVVVGLATRIDLLDRAYLWGVTALVIVAAIAGKWGGSAIAARITGESWRDANVIGILMNTRGLTELVILTVGLELGVIDGQMFTIMVLMALVTTLMATPVLALVSPAHRDRTPVMAHDPA
jgi:Kef-type K+ transport system membrane component KefB